METISLDSDKLLEASLPSSTTDDNKDVDDFLQDRRNDSKKVRRHKLIGVTLFILLLVSNFGWFWQWPRVHEHEVSETSYFSYGAPSKILVNFDHDWVGLQEKEVVGKHRYADEKWDNMFPGYGGSVAVSQDFQKSMGLWPGAYATKENSSMSHYMIGGYHQLHCLSVVRDTIYQLNGTSTNTDPILWDHVLHCVEAVRQGLYCFLDDTLIPLAYDWPGIPNGQPHVCRNREAMHRWAVENSHEAPGNYGPNTKA